MEYPRQTALERSIVYGAMEQEVRWCSQRCLESETEVLGRARTARPSWKEGNRDRSAGAELHLPSGNSALQQEG